MRGRKIEFESSGDRESEVALLVANVDSALRELVAARSGTDGRHFTHLLDLALHTYGSVKHLLPKLNLNQEQRRLVELHLTLLRAEIMNANRSLL